MSVRPITEGEQQQAYGSPVTEMLMLFGASQGFLTHLRFNGIKAQGALTSTPMARMTLPLFVLGGAGAGALLGV